MLGWRLATGVEGYSQVHGEIQGLIGESGRDSVGISLLLASSSPLVI
jgi:hypothetical protein